MPFLPFGQQLNLGFVAAVGGIILIDIVLSGDNALVIGATASRLRSAQRFLAIVWGGAAAIVFRILLAAFFSFLLLVPLLQAIGGVILMIIAVRLLMPAGSGPRFAAHDRFLPAVLTILVADLTMSLDNIIAIGALAKGNVLLLAVGLLISMALLFAASALIARIIERVSILLDLAALVLAYTAANLIIADPLVKRYVDLSPYPRNLMVQGTCIAIIVLIDIGMRWARARRQPRQQLAPAISPVGASATPDDVGMLDGMNALEVAGPAAGSSDAMESPESLQEMGAMVASDSGAIAPSAEVPGITTMAPLSPVEAPGRNGASATLNGAGAEAGMNGTAGANGAVNGAAPPQASASGTLQAQTRTDSADHVPAQAE
jgi:YjbE family integral membrane protein